MIRQRRADRKRSGIERGTGSGKVLNLVFELGMPIMKQCYMSAHLPTRLAFLRPDYIILYCFHITFRVERHESSSQCFTFVAVKSSGNCFVNIHFTSSSPEVKFPLQSQESHM